MIYQIKTLGFSLYGDGTSTSYVVDIAPYLPGINNFSLINAYTIADEQVEISPGSYAIYEVATNLTASLVGTILTVNLPSAPPTWLEPYAGPNATPVPFYVTVSYNG